MHQNYTGQHKVSVVVPIYNEVEVINAFHRELFFCLSSLNHPFEIIYVDDNSNDGTHEYLSEQARNNKEILLIKKTGVKGKAHSLLIGFEEASGDIFVMIDGDLQYPPSEIPAMIEKLSQADVIVSDRKYKKLSPSRKIISKTFRHIFGKTLFGLNYDIQSGLKVFKSEVFKSAKFAPSSAWTFDLEFLLKAKYAGFKITSHSIPFARRHAGKSKVDLFASILEIGSNAISVKMKSLQPFAVPAHSESSMLGAGIGLESRKYITHTNLHIKESAFQTFSSMQLVLFFGMIGLFILALAFLPLETARIFITVLSILYFLDTVFNLHLVLKSLKAKSEISFSDEEIKKIDDNTLPVYSILCPLYKEANVVPHFLESISKLDWPVEKLDVLLLLEEDDQETINTVGEMQLPSYVRIVIVPDSKPKTKPKACNYGLSYARGEYLVIYDAEDMPDPLQLKKAYLGFKTLPKNVRCLQAKLNYYNPNQNLLTKFFTAEYSLWFEFMLTGLQSLRSAIPLGGTSNHFRTQDLVDLHGWDPFNVTEDADLGVRLFKKGSKTAIIDSTTLEEANSNFRNWFRQRSRWIKGYMQTYLVHMRDPLKFLRQNGLKHTLIFQLTVGGKLLFLLINPLMWIITIIYFALYEYSSPIIELVYYPPISYIAVFSWIFGNFLFIYYYMVACARKDQWNLVKYVYLIPIYWLMMSYAGAIAFWQLLFKPHYWEKTIHGLHIKSKVKPAPKMPWLKIPTYLSKVFNNNLKGISDLFRKTFSKKSQEGRKMNILIFNWRDIKHSYAGGAEAYIHEMAKHWVNDGNKVTIFCGNDNLHKGEDIIDGIEVIRRGGTYTVYFFAFIYYLFKFRGKYDLIIDCENGIPFFTPLYVRKPIILVIHHIHQDIINKYLRFPLNRIAANLESKLMPALYKNKNIVTVSGSSRDEILKLGFAQENNIEIIYNGTSVSIDENIINKTDHPSFLYLGRLQEYKNIDVAIIAFAQVVRKHKTARFKIVGFGESYLKLKKLAKKLNVSENIEFLGRVPESEKVKLFSEAWVVLQPSQIEGWGITVIEANACGTPVIASRVHGLRDSVVDGRTGILIEKGDVIAFATAMERIIIDSELRLKLSREAYLWSKNFSWSRSAELFYHLIERNIQGTKNTSLSLNKII
jgi:cellulose synthase/poly-beta-1,6-N-acetylglucosamine synthase-like glycosyltransferase/glycosyltransferase involved in cell wall biosynthesis